MDHVLPKRKPQVFEVNAHRTYLLAVSTKGAAKDRIAEILPLFRRRSLSAKESAKKPSPSLQDLIEPFHAVNGRQLPIERS
jgi:hypothetical protein